MSASWQCPDAPAAGCPPSGSQLPLRSRRFTWTHDAALLTACPLQIALLALLVRHRSRPLRVLRTFIVMVKVRLVSGAGVTAGPRGNPHHITNCVTVATCSALPPLSAPDR